jgi:hypothetical protein
MLVVIGKSVFASQDHMIGILVNQPFIVLGLELSGKRRIRIDFYIEKFNGVQNMVDKVFLIPLVSKGDIGDMPVIIRPELVIIAGKDGRPGLEIFGKFFLPYGYQELGKRKTCVDTEFQGIEELFILGRPDAALHLCRGIEGNIQ